MGSADNADGILNDKGESMDYGWTSTDLELFPESQLDGKRYEIIEGELFMSRQPHYHHQNTCVNLTYHLKAWNEQTKAGDVNFAPGIIFADDDDVAPDLTWCSLARLKKALNEDGKLHAAPELVIEVLSPGSVNERRDREAKLKLYSRRGVEEYWIADWMLRRIEIYRRKNRRLRLVTTLLVSDTLDSPLLPGFRCPVAKIFEFAVEPLNGK
jgi:Uma2 family endonuclease